MTVISLVLSPCSTASTLSFHVVLYTTVFSMSDGRWILGIINQVSPCFSASPSSHSRSVFLFLLRDCVEFLSEISPSRREVSRLPLSPLPLAGSPSFLVPVRGAPGVVINFTARWKKVGGIQRTKVPSRSLARSFARRSEGGK